MTKDQAIAAAKADYQAALGTIVRPEFVTGYTDSHSVDVQTRGALEVRVVETSDDDLAHDTSGFIDPYWDIEVISDPSGLLRDVRSVWMFGPSHKYAE